MTIEVLDYIADACTILAVLYGVTRYMWAKHVLMSKRRTQKRYSEFLEVLSDRESLMVLFLDKIARSIAALAIWAIGIVYLSSPVFIGVTFDTRYFWISVISSAMAILVVHALSKPSDLLYAIRHPEEYKLRVRKKLGKLPDE